MLRARTRRATPANTAVTLTVTHGLGAVPDAWWISGIADTGFQRVHFVDGQNLTNTIDVVHSGASNVTVDVFTLAYQGRLY